MWAQGVRAMIKEEVDAEDIADVVSRWRVSGEQDVAERAAEAASSGG